MVEWAVSVESPAEVGDALPDVHESVETRLRRAEAAVANARKAKQQALEEAHNASDRADAAKTIVEEGKQRLRQATRDGNKKLISVRAKPKTTFGS